MKLKTIQAMTMEGRALQDPCAVIHMANIIDLRGKPVNVYSLSINDSRYEESWPVCGLEALETPVQHNFSPNEKDDYQVGEVIGEGLRKEKFGRLEIFQGHLDTSHSAGYFNRERSSSAKPVDANRMSKFLSGLLTGYIQKKRIK